MEIIPKKTPGLPLWLNILFYASIILLIATVASYFVLDKFIERNGETLKNVEEKLTDQKNPEFVSLKNEVLNYQKKINDFFQIINSHLKTSKFFGFFEKLCHPKAWFSQFKLNSESGSVELSGTTQSFESLGQQILIFEKEPLIEKVELKNVSLTKIGEVDFSVNLSLSKEVIK